MHSERNRTSLLHDFALEVRSGSDLVARFPNAVLLMRAPTPRERPIADRIVQVCREQSPRPDQDGRGMLRRIAGVLAAVDREDAPSFALAAPTGGRVAVLLHGDVQVVVRGPTDLRLSGMESATWVDRIVEEDFDQLDAGFHEQFVPFDFFALDLQAGAVPGGGWTLTRRGRQEGRVVAVAAAARQQPAGGASAQVTPDDPAGTDPTSGLPEGAPDALTGDAGVGRPGTPRPLVRVPDGSSGETLPEPPPVALSPPAFRSVLLIGELTTDADRAPLPILPADDAAEAEAEVPQIDGILCANGHFNDPAALYCRLDGISLAQRTHNHVTRPRPPLGVMVFDDGSSYSVDGDYVLGREPERDEEVQGRRARPLVVLDDEETVSRVHAEIRIQGWTPTIVDRGSVNGTYVAPPGTTVWNPLVPQQPTPLMPGTRVQIGGRTFVYDSHLKI